MGLNFIAAGLGAALAVIGGAYGIVRIAEGAMHATARQPSATNDIRTTMIIACALIEGVTLFAEVVCIMMIL